MKRHSTNRTVRHAPAPQCLAWVGCLVALFVAAPVAAESPPVPDGPAWPRVVWTEDPAHAATVVWTTDDAVAPQTVVVQPAARDANLQTHGRRVPRLRTFEGHEEDDYFHLARVTDLHPATDYAFRVRAGDAWSRRLWFRTAPADRRTVRILYGGDSRSSRTKRRAMNRRIRSLVEEHPDILALAHGGDYVVDGREWRLWREWLADWESSITDSGRILPLIPARGNHDLAGDAFSTDTDHYNAVFGRPGGHRRDYWTTGLGEHALLVTLDTTSSLGGLQRAWLEEQLEAASDDFRWLLAQYHRPAYPAVKRPGKARLHWVPLFEEYGVDLALESDGHVLKRTVPIRDGERHDEGVVYVGEGGLGVPQRSPKTDRWYLQPPGMARAAHHVQMLTIGVERLGYRAFGIDGRVLDRASWRREPPDDLPDLRVRSAQVDGPQTVHVRFDAGLAVESLAPDDFRLEPGGRVVSVRRHPAFDDVAVLGLESTIPADVARIAVDGVESMTGRRVEEGTVQRFGSADPSDLFAETESESTADTADTGREMPASTTQDRGMTCGTTSGAGPPAPTSLLLLAVAGLARRSFDGDGRRP